LGKEQTVALLFEVVQADETKLLARHHAENHRYAKEASAVHGSEVLQGDAQSKLGQPSKEAMHENEADLSGTKSAV